MDKRLTLVLLVSLAWSCAPQKDELAETRKHNLQLRDQVTQLQTAQKQLQTQITGLQDQVSNLQKLPADVIQFMDLPVGLKIDTGSGLLDRDGKPGYEAVRLVVVPTDSLGYPVRLPGTFTAEAFDLLSKPQPRKLGQVEIPIGKVGDLWYETYFGRYYSFEVPLTEAPSGKEITVRVVFVNALNGQSLEAQAVLPVPSPLVANVPAASQPTTGQ